MITTLLIFHMLCAVALLGALTHQALSVWWPPPPGQRNFFASYRAVRAGAYTNTVTGLFVIVACMGALLYPTYRLSVRVILEELKLNSANGIFELKEHFVALGLGLLPAYWYYWKQDFAQNRATIRILTTILALIVWWGFIVGHVLNNIRGFGA